MSSADLILPDARERERAATTFDRNVVVTAGAGTGKTTLLVDRLVHLVLREPDPVPITRIVALTFTNKAAAEMRLRLRERLHSYVAVRLDSSPPDADAAKAAAAVRDLIGRYQLSKGEIDRRCGEALRQIERSYIGTLHSFAALLLRLYPAEAGVDPQFSEDDGLAFRKHFAEQWSLWLDRELGREGGRRGAWRALLDAIDLETLEQVASSLCSEMVPLESLCGSGAAEELDAVLRSWLAAEAQTARELLRRYPEERHQLDRWLRHCLAVIEGVLKDGEIAPGAFAEQKRWFAEKGLRRAGGWSDADFRELQRLARVARGLLGGDRAVTAVLRELLVPLAESCRRSFVQAGFVSFDGLLVRARNLLRDHNAVREELKGLFKAILVDEFQDTDPVQYELILYLSERPGESANDWRAVRLQPGKVFVVGDPKQSIYAFRRADIQGYLDVVERLILPQGGTECRLTTNFRSAPGILDVVNGVFEPLIRERSGLQPRYVPIEPPRRPEASPDRSSLPRVLLRRVESSETLNADRARRLEAESLARWLEEAVLGKVMLPGPNGEAPARPRDIAFLFRKLTDVHLYLEPLRRRGIRYVVEGEKHFYATQEIVDAVNLLRAVDNPYDRAALVGLLRSAVGGLSDTEIYRLHAEGLLDYRSLRRPAAGAARALEPVRDLYAALDRLHLETRLMPVPDAVERVFDAVPIRLLAARSFSGEQAVANLEKIRQQAAVLSRQGPATFKAVIAQLERRVLEVEEESESALAEETVDAVKILSIHKAKGLEFPIVVLPDARGAVAPGRPETGVRYDWSTGLIGLRAGEHANPAAIYLDEAGRRREEEEQKRLFYVAMTRAREHLVLSSPPLKVDGGSFVAMLQESVPELTSLRRPGRIAVGKGTLQVEVVYETPQPPRRRPAAQRTPPRESWESFARQWAARQREYDEAGRTPLFVSPTALERQEKGAPRRRRDLFTALDPRLVGILAHRFLQALDFRAARDGAALEDELERFLEALPEAGIGPSRAAMLRELREIFKGFASSPAFAELASADILGREVPLLMPWGGRIMEGVIDLVYEREGRLYLADYKTERVRPAELRQAARRYRGQARIYACAAASALGREVAGFKVIFVRLGEAVEIGATQLSEKEARPAGP
ncbi:MAG TPA: UvrD-helicase domain-containing protein [candidate division Zixibacteria bacterium]|nr:UvrD-helicase domain-containing protein [candidate division Zixibacteria bacterium]